MGVTLSKIAATVACAAMFFALSGQAEELAHRAADGVPIDGAVLGGAHESGGAPPRNDRRRGGDSRGQRSVGEKLNRAAHEATEGAYIEAMADGTYEVSWPGGCVARYDKQGRPSYYSEPCDEPKVAESQLIVDSYRR